LADVKYLHILALFHNISLCCIIIVVCVNGRILQVGSYICICNFMAQQGTVFVMQFWHDKTMLSLHV